MRSRSLAEVLVGLLMGVVTSCGSTSDNRDDSSAGPGSTGNTQAATASASGSNTTASTSASTSGAATSGATNATTGGGGGSSSGGTATTATSATTAATNTSGGAGNANATTGSSSTGEGGAGGDPGACPSEPPLSGSSCSSLGMQCVYEDCEGAGRAVAQCTPGSWFVTTGECGETVHCNGGSMTCAPGEVCLIMAGGAFLQACVPNTCEGEAVRCDCIDGCFADCPVFGDPETGITITCNTCPSGMCP